MKKIFYILLSAGLAACSTESYEPLSPEDDPASQNETVGQPLSKWSEGFFDIHAINTGRGECTLFIMPDGTSMMIDAGEFVEYSAEYPLMPIKPNSETRPYKTFVEYSRHFLPANKQDSLDYFMLTHYHMDHFGHEESQFAKDPEGGYVISGISGVYSEFPFRKLVDRSYPDYSIKTEASVSFYPAFVKYNVEHRNLNAEKFVVGTNSQFPLTVNPSKYPDFKIWNYAASGYVWNGNDKITYSEMNRENAVSCNVLFSYGPFDYFTSGDCNDMAIVKPVTDAIGREIEAMKCLHHMSNQEPFDYEVATFKPLAIVTQSFYMRQDQPQWCIIRDNAEKYDLFFTNIDSSIQAVHQEDYDKCKGINGHYVIRVSPGGKIFYIYKLRDTDTTYTIESIFGPYKSK